MCAAILRHHAAQKLGATRTVGKLPLWIQRPRKRNKFAPLTFSALVDSPLAPLQTYTLPSGLQIQCPNPEEVPFLYEEIYTSSTYLNHGISIPPGAVIIDVGANIGMFTMYAAERSGLEATIISIEPMPPLHSALQSNIISHREWCQSRTFAPATVHVVNAAVGDGSTRSAKFMYYADATGWSTMYPDDAEVSQNMSTFLDSALDDMRGIPATPLAILGHRMKQVRWLRPVYDMIKAAKIQSMIASGVEYVCDMTSIDEVVERYHLNHVDLLKIDVERAELDVLRGVDVGFWRNVLQVVMEVHDVGGRKQAVVALLEQVAGFDKVVVEQTRDLQGSSIHNVYAMRL